MATPEDVALARTLGIPVAAIPKWREMANQPAAPPGRAVGPVFAGPAAAPPPPAPPGGPVPSYEGVSLQGLGGAPAPQQEKVDWPPKVTPSYEGATLPGVAAPAKPIPGLATGSNVDTSGARSSGTPTLDVKNPKVAAQVAKVLAASDETRANVKANVEQTERDKNLAGATFADQPQGGGGGGPYGMQLTPPTMISPGGRRPQSWQVQQGIELSPETKDLAESAAQHGQTAAGLDYMAGQQQANYERGYLDRFYQAHEQHAAEQRTRAETFQRSYDDSLGRLDELRTQVREAKIDPFNGTEGVSRLMGAIAIGLGAFGSRGGANKGLEAFNNSIALNIKKQEGQLDKLERGMRAEQNFLGTLKAQFGDTAVAKEAAWMAYLERAKVEMAKILGSPDVRDPQLQANYERAMKGIDGELAAHHERWDQLTKDRIVRHDINAPPVFAGGMGSTKSNDPLFVPTGPNGQGFLARSEKEAQAARGVITAEQDIIPMLERLKLLRSQTNIGERYAYNKGAWESERMAQIKSLEDQVSLKLRDLSATSPGAMDAGMQKLAQGIQGNWTSAQGNPEAAADEFIGTIRRQKDSMMRGQGGQAERQQLTVDQKGNTVTKAVGQARFASPKGEMPSSTKAVAP